MYQMAKIDKQDKTRRRRRDRVAIYYISKQAILLRRAKCRVVALYSLCKPWQDRETRNHTKICCVSYKDQVLTLMQAQLIANSCTVYTSQPFRAVNTKGTTRQF